ICASYRDDFRPIHEVQAAFSSRPIPDEPLCALLWEYKDRGKKGYDLTERFFELFSITTQSRTQLIERVFVCGVKDRRHDSVVAHTEHAATPVRHSGSASG